MWQEIEHKLYRRFEFKDFKQAFAFMTEVSKLAEDMQHHPRWSNEWNVVEIWLSTHEAGNTVTEKDRDLAAAIDNIKL